MADILPLPTPHAEEWITVEVKLPPPLIRIEPGLYEAISTRLRRFSAFRRENLRLDFTVYQGSIGDLLVLGEVPMFLRWPGRKGLSPTSKLARLLYVAGVKPTRYQRLSLEPLRGKAWRIEVADARHDASDGALGAATAYSIVKRVLERLT